MMIDAELDPVAVKLLSTKYFRIGSKAAWLSWVRLQLDTSRVVLPAELLGAANATV